MKKFYEIIMLNRWLCIDLASFFPASATSIREEHAGAGWREKNEKKMRERTAWGRGEEVVAGEKGEDKKKKKKNKMSERVGGREGGREREEKWGVRPDRREKEEEGREGEEEEMEGGRKCEKEKKRGLCF